MRNTYGRGARQGRNRSRSRHPKTQGKPKGEANLNVSGVLQLMPDGYGFMRDAKHDYRQEQEDPFVPAPLIQSLRLLEGVEIKAKAIENPQGRGPYVEEILEVDGLEPESWKEQRQPFKSLVAEMPDERIRLETVSDQYSTRVFDLMAPIGKGQRCLIVAPPKTGKTMLLQAIAEAITKNHPEIYLIVLLIDERPEEVTDMRRTVEGEVLASSSDESPQDHIRMAELVQERAMRLVEVGKDVVILLDSITRLARAYNSGGRGSGRVLSGGMDSNTMERPRRFFGAARNVENGGSLTVIGTALVDTGSRMDEVIFQEFKGTGNTEVVLDRQLFERRIFPSIDIAQTGTRKEEKLMEPDEYQKVSLLRRALARVQPTDAMEMLLNKLKLTESNAVFLKSLGG